MTAPLSPMMMHVLRQFPLYGFRWHEGSRRGFWIETAALTEQAGRWAGFGTLKALERRGLLHFQMMAPYAWSDDRTPVADWQRGEHFVALTPEGVLVRAEIEGVNWR